MLAVLTYNIRYGNNLADISQWLETYETTFDIICFQEFPALALDAFLRAKHTKSFDTQYSHSFTRKGKQYGQLTLYNKQKLTLLEYITLPLGPSILERSKVKGERSALITRFQYNNKEFLLANTHLVCWALNHRRLFQLGKIVEYITTFSDPQLPTLIIGDFNYGLLVGKKKLFQFMHKHLFLNAHQHNTFKFFVFPYQLDYIFYKDCIVGNVAVLPLQFSDHLPAKFQLKL